MNNVIYKLILSTILIFGSSNISYSQENLNSISKIKYTILDSFTKKANPLFGSHSNEITFKLIELKNLSTDSIICGVEINVSSSETVQAGNSIAFASNRHGNFDVLYSMEALSLVQNLLTTKRFSILSWWE